MPSESTPSGLPHWQLESIYPGLDSQQYSGDKERLESAVNGLQRYFDERSIGSVNPAAGERSVAAGERSTTGGEASAPDAASHVAVLEGALDRLEECYSLLATLQPFVGLRIATDAFDERSQAEASSLQPFASHLRALSARFKAWLGQLDVVELASQSMRIKDHEYMLLRAKVESEHLLSDQTEELAAVLDDSGGSAWAKLYTNLISRETVRAAVLAPDERSGDGDQATPGGVSEGEYGVAELRSLQGHPDAGVRQRALEAELTLLRRNAVPYAAALNGIKGQVDALARRRGWEGALEYSLFQHGITAASLEAMQSACAAHFEVLRGYLRTKARLLGKQKLPWYDLYAPLPQALAPRFTWDEAKEFVVERFGSYTQDMARFAQRTFAAGWLDVPPRKGKRNGAFCSAIHPRGESRVMLNFSGNLTDVFTLAHELGHAYHNDCKVRFGRDMLQVPTPMTLAETASIFCETIVFDGLIKSVEGPGRLAVLEQNLQHVSQLVLDIHSRFLFESAVFQRRRSRDLSVDELNELMIDAQDRSYGDVLDPDARNPLMWAHKGHYYSSSRSFYNYPYTFGFLFGLGLYAQYQQEPNGFSERYDELLASTGMADAASLAQRFGIDIEDERFWAASLEVITARQAAFAELVGESVGA